MAVKFLLLICLCMVIQCLFANPLPTDDVFSLMRPTATDPGYRLPDDFEVLEYKLTLTPYFDTGDAKAFTFVGSVAISVNPKKVFSKKITMHSKDLEINKQISVMDQDNNVVLLRDTEPLEFDKKYDFFTIHLKEDLEKTKQYTITIQFTGVIREDMSGFYRSSYKQEDKVKWMGTTQFQPVHARKVFPCFDEPKYKAIFTITINRPDEFSTSLSNMPIDPTKTTHTSIPPTRTSETFFPTPKMSTYLVAFIVSDYVAAKQTTDKKFGVWARPQASNMGAYPFITGQNLVKKMDEFTMIKYYEMNPKMKMDQAAIPDFSAGAMENWGLLTYREASLMIDEKESSAKHRQNSNGILAHEIAHMWFGDLVTCDWWSYTWLNEGFARYFQYRLPDMVENLEMMTQFPVAQIQTAFQVDTSITSSPMSHPGVNSPTDIALHFGSISYNKGASVIRMIEHLMGTEAFKAGLNGHLSAKKFQTVIPEDLFNALQTAATAANSLQNYPDVTINSVMGSWTSQAGYPLLTVNIDYDTGTMKISQERFVKYGENVPDTLYQIPITFATKNSAMFNDTKPLFVMKTKSVTKDKAVKGHEWVVFNKQQTGYYRVNYDDHTWMMLAKTLMGPERTEIHTLNRAQIVDDVFNLAREKKMNYTMMFEVIQFLQNETDYAPWSASFAGFSYLRQMFFNVPHALKSLEKHMSVLMTNVVNELTLAETETDSHLRKLFRANTLTLACQLGHAECILSSMELFQRQRTSRVNVNPNLREHVYCNALRYGNETDFKYLWEKYSTENVVNEQIVILGALGCSDRAEDIKAYLKQTITKGSWIRQQDIMTAFNSALMGNSKNVEHVFKFLQENFEEMKKFYTSANILAIFNNVASRLKPMHRETFMSFLSANKAKMSESEFQSGVAAIMKADQADLWGFEVSREIEEWIALKYYSGAGTNAVISVTLLLTSLVTMFYGN